MYRIKQLPEDFVVEEVISLPISDHGDYSYWELKKKKVNTLDAVRKIARGLKIQAKQVGFSGNKDRNAVTTQMISLYKVSQERVEHISLLDITLRPVGEGDQPIHLGMHSQNRFKTTVRNIEKGPVVPKKIPNLFGEQRFSENNVEVGRALVKRDFKRAAELADRDEVGEHLAEKPQDFVGALRRMQKPLLKLYLHSYQSHLWNETVKRLLGRNPESPHQSVPMAGFGLERTDDELYRIIDELMEEEGITQHDFVIREIPELSSEGMSRSLFMEVEDLEICPLEADELNLGKKKCVLRFTLPKGCYATVLIDFLFRESCQ
jgi:tRNA(Glu) U13 pseudouridine synthase TruD